ncbi:MAG: serine/threonine protein kinase [Polyangiaceae bacterium]|nr:serine/threonine protein kinase [Polyangiaceae bacterium]
MLSVLGAGGMGVVHEVLDHRTGRRRALKVLRTETSPTEEQLARFRLEATVTAQVRSPHLVEGFDAGFEESAGVPYLLLELLEGEDLGKRLAVGPIPLEQVARFVDVIASALDQLHESDIVHRDLKPENVFLAKGPDGSETVKLLDFGAAKVLTLSLNTTRALGSPLYMSPEAIEGEATIDGRADIYSLGHLAFTLLTGQAYWEKVWRDARGYYAVLVRMMRGDAPKASTRANELGVTLPQGFDAWFARATARDRSQRFDTAGECAAAFGRLLTPARLARPQHWRWAAPGVLVLVVALGSWLLPERLATSSSTRPPRSEALPTESGTNGVRSIATSARARAQQAAPPPRRPDALSTSSGSLVAQTLAKPRQPARKTTPIPSAGPSPSHAAPLVTLDHTRIR